MSSLQQVVAPPQHTWGSTNSIPNGPAAAYGCHRTFAWTLIDANTVTLLALLGPPLLMFLILPFLSCCCFNLFYPFLLSNYSLSFLITTGNHHLPSCSYSIEAAFPKHQHWSFLQHISFCAPEDIEGASSKSLPAVAKHRFWASQRVDRKCKKATKKRKFVFGAILGTTIWSMSWNDSNTYVYIYR